MQKTLYVRSGSRYRIAKGVEILEAAAYCAARAYEANRPQLASPAEAQSFLVGQLRHCLEEYFCMVFLDAQMRVIGFEKSFRGTVDAAIVHPREIVRDVLDRNAAAVILAHNHPSGYAQPSQADEALTKRLRAALDLIDVRVLDHIIVGESACFSFAESGLL